MVKAVPSPLSSFMVQLKNFLHIPSIGAKPANNFNVFGHNFSNCIWDAYQEQTKRKQMTLLHAMFEFGAHPACRSTVH